MGKKVLVIGASSGIGRELAIQYNDLGCEVIVTARNTDKLKELSKNNNIVYEYMDITDYDNTIHKLKLLLTGVDIVIISAGIGYINKELDFSKELETIRTNIAGFSVVADEAFNYFKSIKKGHIVAISSIASLRGDDIAPAYSASKAYVSNYLEGLRKKSVKENLDIKITTISPGFVDTQMAQGDGLFWVEPVKLIAKDIIIGVNKGKTKMVVSKRWNLIAFIIKIIPDFIYNKL